MGLIRGKLGRRIVGLMIVASAALSLIAAGFQLYVGYNRDLNRVSNELTVIEKSFNPGLERALWQFNFDQADTLIGGIFAQSNVTYVRLEASTGQVLERGNQSATHRIESDFELFHATEDNQRTQVGTLLVYASLEEARRQLFNQFLATLGSNFLKTLLASVLMLFIFERMVARHLGDVASQINSPHWPTLNRPIELARPLQSQPDELDKIVEALNQSTINIQNANRSTKILQDRLETVLNAATSGIIALTPGGQAIFANPRARELLGLNLSSGPFEWPETIHFLEAETLTPLDASADPIRRILSGHVLRNETHLMTSGEYGEKRSYVRIDSAKLEGKDDDISAVMVIEDVSEQERTRQVVERRSRLDALGQLTGGIAHDFNNLLGSMLYAVEMASEEDDRKERAELLGSAYRSIEKGRDLTTRLLAFAKKQPGVAHSRRVGKVFDDFVSLIKPMLEAKVALNVKINNPDLMVYCDQTQLETALMNLVLNSRDAILRSGKGHSITLSARVIDQQAFDANKDGETQFVNNLVSTGRGNTFVEIAVSDDGPGMEEETRARATDPFFTTKDTNSGTGLGLSMVYGFVQQSDGDLRIYSELGIGTTIRLILPVGAMNFDPEKKEPSVQQFKVHGKTALLVEDEPELLRNMTRALDRIGFNTISAQSGAEAASIVEKGAVFDIMITDIVMPGGIGGFELAQIVEKIHPGKPILFMSGYTGFSDAEMGSVKRPILQKPTTRAELTNALQLALRDSDK